MRIVTWNVNGIRAAIRKGIDEYFESMNADIWMLQEVRALPEQLPKDWDWPEGYSIHLHAAEKKGYSGVATMSKTPLEVLEIGKGGSKDPDDLEGRVITSKHGDIICINTYLPSGSNKAERQEFKEAWMQ